MNFWLRLKRRSFRLAASLIVHTLARVKITGLDKIRKAQGTVIVVSNHLGRVDFLITLALASRDDLIIVIAEKYRRSGIMRWVVRQLDLLFLERFEADLGTLREVLRRLQRGGFLVIAPEGTRSPTESLLQGKPGAAFLASKSGATIIPIGVIGTEDRLIKGSLRRLRRPPIHIAVGEGFTVPPLPKEGREEFLVRYTDEIMTRIAALLPEKYRGVYATHPRLAELTV
ncbi:MAG: lysophospholipid acyltransferase family protein [Anaerolineales bacterium]